MSTTLHANTIGPKPVETESLIRPAAAFQQALHRFGLDRGDLRGTLHVRADAALDIQSVGACGGTARALTTMSLDQHKSWIGIMDREFAEGKFQPMLGTPARSPEALDRAIFAEEPGAVEELQLAAGYYLVGESQKVRAYRDVIEKHLAPMPANLYVLDSIEIYPGAALVIEGYPAALIARSIRIHAGGELRLLTIARIELENLTRDR